MASQPQHQQRQPVEPYPPGGDAPHHPLPAEDARHAETRLVPHPEKAAGDEGEDAETGEIRAAERSAERAAAVAAAEGFHPLRVRPYVSEPDGEPGETTVRPLIGAPADGPDGPATADLGLFPTIYSGLEYAPKEPAPPYAETAAARGRHRRRRRGIVITAAAVAASALAAGAVAVTGQMTGHEQGGTDRALPDQGTSMPDVKLPTDAALATATVAPPISAAAPTTSATTTASPTGTPSGSPSASVSVAPTTPATASPTSSPAAGAPATTQPVAPPSTEPSTPPVTSAILQLGDSGPGVTELQQRLTHVWVYHGPLDGVFDREVQQSVAMFQVWYGVRGDPVGVYGPHTRETLERQGL